MTNVQQTIELDCPPGSTRPKDLIEGILKDTGLTVTEHPTPMFGYVQYSFDVDREEWTSRIQPIIKPRIMNLYDMGVIRYGSW
jgi:hypothetical protein